MTTSLKHVCVKVVQNNSQMTLTWTTKLGKGRKEWQKECVERDWGLRKFKTLVKTKFADKVIMFEKALKFKEVVTYVKAITSLVMAYLLQSLCMHILGNYVCSRNYL